MERKNYLPSFRLCAGRSQDARSENQRLVVPARSPRAPIRQQNGQLHSKSFKTKFKHVDFAKLVSLLTVLWRDGLESLKITPRLLVDWAKGREI